MNIIGAVLSVTIDVSTDTTIKIVTGKDVLEYLQQVAHLHIKIFKSFPYLYDRSQEYEERYLSIMYANADSSILVLVYDNQELVGAATARSLAHPLRADGVQQCFEALGYDPAKVLFFTDCVLEKNYRGRGIGTHFYTEREQYATSQGFDYVTLCRVERPKDHSLRTSDYRPLDQFWKKRGYRPNPNIRVQYTWKDVGDDYQTPKHMQFWVKDMR